jgi:hypothetical protein
MSRIPSKDIRKTPMKLSLRRSRAYVLRIFGAIRLDAIRTPLSLNLDRPWKGCFALDEELVDAKSRDGP